MDLEVRVQASPTRHVVFLDKEFYSAFSAAFTQVYKLVSTGDTGDTLLGVTLQWTSIPLSGAKSGGGGGGGGGGWKV